MYGTIRDILCVIWAMLHSQDKNVIDTKIENCSIPPLKQGVKVVLVSTGYVIYRIVKVGNETKSVFQATYCKNKSKNPKKNYKITKSKKKSSLSFLVCVCEHQ